MKKFLKFISVIVIVSFFIIHAFTSTCYCFQKSYTSSTFYSVNSKPSRTKITHLQTKGQVDFFRNALDELSAASPEQVIEIWIKAEQTRNGVFHYAVACDELKAALEKEMGSARESFWIIGGSSPWLDRYEIVYTKKLSESSYETKIRYYWASSTGPSKPTQETLVIIKKNDTWCVKEVR